MIRHTVPGPITREKLEAAELRSEPKRNLTQLKRSTSGGGLGVGIDKKVDNKKSENQVRKSFRIRGSIFDTVLYASLLYNVIMRTFLIFVTDRWISLIENLVMALMHGIATIRRRIQNAQPRRILIQAVRQL
jgi:hypothetical protein